VFNPARRLLLGITLLALSGCGPKDDPLHRTVTGTVTLNGKPLSGAMLRFIPVEGTEGTGGQARTGPDGTYRLLDGRGNPGAAPGNYKVTVSKRLMPNGSDVPPDDNTPPMNSPARESLPAKYSDAGHTELQATVPDAGGTIDFSLKTASK
jgi:hypothetical protein